jgi:hypothetical protein
MYQCGLSGFGTIERQEYTHTLQPYTYSFESTPFPYDRQESRSRNAYLSQPADTVIALQAPLSATLRIVRIAPKDPVVLSVRAQGSPTTQEWP